MTKTIVVRVFKTATIMPIELDKLPEVVRVEAIRLGLELVINRGMSRLIGDRSMSAAKAAIAIANENREKLYAGTIRIAARPDISGAIRTEAIRLARQAVKDALKQEGKKISMIYARDITMAAEKLLQSNPEFITEAKTNLGL